MRVRTPSSFGIPLVVLAAALASGCASVRDVSQHRPFRDLVGRELTAQREVELRGDGAGGFTTSCCIGPRLAAIPVGAPVRIERVELDCGGGCLIHSYGTATTADGRRLAFRDLISGEQVESPGRLPWRFEAGPARGEQDGVYASPDGGLVCDLPLAPLGLQRVEATWEPDAGTVLVREEWSHFLVHYARLPMPIPVQTDEVRAISLRRLYDEVYLPGVLQSAPGSAAIASELARFEGQPVLVAAIRIKDAYPDGGQPDALRRLVLTTDGDRVLAIAAHQPFEAERDLAGALSVGVAPLLRRLERCRLQGPTTMEGIGR